MTHLTQLTSILVPPDSPYENQGDWKGIEKKLGIQLPEDYKEFIEIYGTGIIRDKAEGTVCDISVLNPFSENKAFDLSGRLVELKDYIEEGHKRYPKYYPYPSWPMDNGIICWAVTGNGDYFFWLPKGVPNEWRIVAKIDSLADTIKFDISGMGNFLLKLLCDQLPDNLFLPFERPVFEPLRNPEP